MLRSSAALEPAPSTADGARGRRGEVSRKIPRREKGKLSKHMQNKKEKNNHGREEEERWGEEQIGKAFY
jgi:hypothetical protein